MGSTLEELIEGRSRKEKINVIAKIYDDVSNGRARLIDPNPPSSFLEYMLRLEYSLWFYSSLAFSLLAVLTVVLSQRFHYLYPLRIVLGALYVLFLPGYALVEALYPKEVQINDIEKLGLSIALSLAVVPVTGFLLNYTKGGVTLPRLLLFNTSLIVATLLVGLYRKYRVTIHTARSRIVS